MQLTSIWKVEQLILNRFEWGLIIEVDYLSIGENPESQIHCRKNIRSESSIVVVENDYRVFAQIFEKNTKSKRFLY